ncbi:hypothetical protein HanRHA438_Chr11g0481031 [Helianthus annuus]|nr:hypothetical protein HanRHA438_Chr11g0481031 [Helianthus annuus]
MKSSTLLVSLASTSGIIMLLLMIGPTLDPNASSHMLICCNGSYIPILLDVTN